MDQDDMALQATAFTRYLIKRSATPAIIKLYQDALQNTTHEVIASDEKLLGLIARHGWLLGVIDGGLALARPHSEVRRRLYLLLAILEASPDYWDSFLPKQRNPFYILAVGYSGVRAVVRALCGLVIVKVYS